MTSELAQKSRLPDGCIPSALYLKVHVVESLKQQHTQCNRTTQRHCKRQDDLEPYADRGDEV
jgi:hypothetical protein